MADDLIDSIEENAAGPQEFEQDRTRAKQHKLQDQIAADKYIRSKAATDSSGFGLRFAKIKPPGAG